MFGIQGIQAGHLPHQLRHVLASQRVPRGPRRQQSLDNGLPGEDGKAMLLRQLLTNGGSGSCPGSDVPDGNMVQQRQGHPNNCTI